MGGPINIANILVRATRFYLGHHLLHDDHTATVPVWLDFHPGKDDAGWVVWAKFGEMNPHYLNVEPRPRDKEHPEAGTTYWRYKVGNRFTTIEDAIAHFNRVVYGDLRNTR